MKPRKPTKRPAKKMEIKLKDVTPQSLAVLDSYDLLDFEMSAMERVKRSYDIYKNEKAVEEIARAIFHDNEIKDIGDFGNFSIKKLKEGIDSFLLQLASSSRN